MAGITVKFKNTSNEHEASIFFMDNEEEIFKAHLAPSGEINQDSEPGDNWIAKARSSGAKLGTFTVTSPGQTFKILWGRDDVKGNE